MAKAKKRRLAIKPTLTEPVTVPRSAEEVEARKVAYKLFGLKEADVFAFKDNIHEWRIITTNGQKFILSKTDI